MKILILFLLSFNAMANDKLFNFCSKLNYIANVSAGFRDGGLDPEEALKAGRITELDDEIIKKMVNGVYFDPAFIGYKSDIPGARFMIPNQVVFVSCMKGFKTWEPLK